MISDMPHSFASY